MTSDDDVDDDYDGYNYDEDYDNVDNVGYSHKDNDEHLVSGSSLTKI